MQSACLDSITHPSQFQDHSAYIPDHGNCPVTARTVQGMARARSGQAPAWPLVFDRSARRDSGIKYDFACTFTRHFPPVLVVRRSQSCLRLKGRARTLSGPSPDLSPARTVTPSAAAPSWTRWSPSNRGAGVSPARVPSKGCRVPRRQQGGRKRGAAEPIDTGAGAAAPGCGSTGEQHHQFGRSVTGLWLDQREGSGLIRGHALSVSNRRCP